MMKSLTVVVPVLNRVDMVQRTLESIVAGRSLPERLIIVDNGSDDGTFELCRSWAAERRRAGMDVRVVLEPKRGAACARNAGLAQCATDYVYFFDSDDDFDAEAVADIRRSAATADLLYLPVGQTTGGPVAPRAYRPTAVPAYHVLSSMFITASMVFRTSWLREIGGWDERLTTWDDWELGVRALVRRPRVGWLTQRTYHCVHLHAESQTGASFADTLDATLRSARAALADVDAAPQLSERERRSCVAALYLRAAIMSGKLKAEGSLEGASTWRSLAAEMRSRVGLHHMLAASILKTYTSLGGRGAWRLAATLVA